MWQKHRARRSATENIALGLALLTLAFIAFRQEFTMARLDAITTALGNISTQLTQLSTQIGELQAGTVSQEEIDAVAAQAQSIADAVDAAIEPDAGEEAAPPSP